MRKKINLSSVKSKLIISMVAIAAIPIILITINNYIASTKSAMSEYKVSLNWAAWYIECEFNDIFARTELSLQTLAASPSTADFIKNGTSGSTVKNQMDIINESFDDGNTITLSNSNGMMILRSDNGTLTDISSRDYWQGAMAGETTASGVLVSSSTGVRSMSLAVPVYDSDTNEVIGVLHRSFDLSAFRDILGEDGEEAFLVDHEGTLASHALLEISAEDEPTTFLDAKFMNSDSQNEIYETTSEATGKTSILAYVKEPVTGYIICDAVALEDITASARSSAMTSIISGLVLMIIAGLLAYSQAVHFVKPILAVNNALSSLAGGIFSKIEKFTNRNDEFGQMVANTNTLVDELSTIVGSIKESSSTVNGASDELANMADQIARTTESVATSVQHIASGAIQQAEDIQSAAEETNTITDAVGSVQNSTVQMTELANRMKTASEASTSSLDILQSTSSEMTEKIEEISSRISSTQNAVSNINERVEGISGIASQTNLLSLNASIEAARAGEMGKGFAVVAEEIRKLADDSDLLASEIRAEMDDLLAEAEQAVNAATQVMNGNIEQQKALSTTFESVHGMLADIEETVKSVSKISNEANTCVSSNTAVSNAMTSLSAISEENAASSESTGAAVEELSATVTTLADSASHLKDIAEQLNEEIKFFK